MALKALGSKIISVIYPQRCVFCGKVNNYTNQGYICGKCRDEYKPISGNVCEKCGKPIPLNNICRSCSSKKLYYEKGFSVYEYDNSVRKFIHKIKFYKRRHYCRYAALEMYNYAENNKIPNVDYVMAVPMHPLNFFIREYNQAELMAKDFAKLRNETYVRGLEKIRYTKAQHSLKEKERYENIKKAFRVKTDVKDKTILLIDDVFTTGSTVNECSKVLKKAGAKAVYVFTFSIVNNDK